MRIGINVGYFAGMIPESLPADVAAAERAGFESVWCAAPAQDRYYRERLDIGFAARGGRPSGFEVVATVPVVIDADVERAADRIRPSIALYAGGMGARGANFHHAVFVRMGHEAAANAIQDAYLSGDRRAAIAAVPTSLIDEIALIGPEARIRDRLALWRESVVDTLLVHGMPDDIPAMARALDLG